MKLRWIFLAPLLLLNGCFVSEAPLISPATADYPLPAAARVEKYRWGGSGRQLEEAADLVRSGSYYVLRLENGDQRFLLKRIDGDKFIAQEESSDDKPMRYQYALLVVDGERISEYTFSHTRNAARDDECAALSDDAKERFGIVDTPDGDCAVASLGSLKAVFLHLLQTAAHPRYVYVMK